MQTSVKVKQGFGLSWFFVTQLNNFNIKWVFFHCFCEKCLQFIMIIGGWLLLFSNHPNHRANANQMISSQPTNVYQGQRFALRHKVQFAPSAPIPAHRTSIHLFNFCQFMINDGKQQSSGMQRKTKSSDSFNIETHIFFTSRQLSDVHLFHSRILVIFAIFHYWVLWQFSKENTVKLIDNIFHDRNYK